MHYFAFPSAISLSGCVIWLSGYNFFWSSGCILLIIWMHYFAAYFVPQTFPIRWRMLRTGLNLTKRVVHCIAVVKVNIPEKGWDGHHLSYGQVSPWCTVWSCRWRDWGLLCPGVQSQSISINLNQSQSISNLGCNLKEARDGDRLGGHQTLKLRRIGTKFGKEGFRADKIGLRQLFRLNLWS